MLLHLKADNAIRDHKQSGNEKDASYAHMQTVRALPLVEERNNRTGDWRKPEYMHCRSVFC